MTTPSVCPVIRARVEAELSAVERDEDVAILFAAESGSRAWGFPSLDSDYDVRFVYRRTLAGYLKVEPARDVVERPVDAALDIGGWDVRKALALLARSNAIVGEWLASPIRYRWNGPAAERLADFARHTADLSALAYHYEHQARRSFGEVSAAEGGVRLKTYCYALRPALALLWLRRRAEPPPMNLHALLAGLEVPRDVSDAIDELTGRKASARESDAAARVPALDGFVAGVLGSGDPAPRPSRRAGATAQADALFASMVLEAHAAPALTPPEHRSASQASSGGGAGASAA